MVSFCRIASLPTLGLGFYLCVFSESKLGFVRVAEWEGIEAGAGAIAPGGEAGAHRHRADGTAMSTIATVTAGLTETAAHLFLPACLFAIFPLMPGHLLSHFLFFLLSTIALYLLDELFLLFRHTLLSLLNVKEIKKSKSNFRFVLQA